VADGYTVSLAGLERITHGLEDVKDELGNTGVGVQTVLDCLPKGAFGSLPESGLAEAAHVRCAREAVERVTECVNDLTYLKEAVATSAKAYERTDDTGAEAMGVRPHR
jgi:hypothetical protein